MGVRQPQRHRGGRDGRGRTVQEKYWCEVTLTLTLNLTLNLTLTLTLTPPLTLTLTVPLTLTTTLIVKVPKAEEAIAMVTEAITVRTHMTHAHKQFRKININKTKPKPGP